MPIGRGITGNAQKASPVGSPSMGASAQSSAVQSFERQDFLFGTPSSRSLQEKKHWDLPKSNLNIHINHIQKEKRQAPPRPHKHGKDLGSITASMCSFTCNGNDGFCPACSNGPCSDDPNCHQFKEKCPKFNDRFRSNYRLNPKLPPWLEKCGKVLRFYAFYQEPVAESNIENFRIHQCEIRYFLDDDKIEVYEPKTFDPGFVQGMLIRKQHIPMPSPANDTYYLLDDINVGCEITFFGKTFFITGCDDLTRRHLNRLGIPVQPNVEMPTDPYTVWREDRIRSLFARKANINLDQDKFKKFLANNGKVLRFWAYWDDRCNEGLLRQFLVHYFLEDETIEIKEIVDPQGRIRGATNFLNKGRLLKNYKDLVPMTGIREDALLVLNTGGMNICAKQKPTFMTDRLCPGIDVKEYVTDKDLAIGAVLNVYGRPFILTSCDTATQAYYRDKYDVQDFTPLELDPSEKRQTPARMQTPPHIGIGDEVDTLLNWDKLQPTQPKRDELALLVKEKDVLGFEAQFENALNKVNSARRFIIKIFMIDNTMQIFEKPHPNTGLKQGTFLSRSLVRRNGNGLPPRYELGENSEYYSTSDYYVGNVLDVNGFRFLLTKADEFTLKYMEDNPHLFPQSSLCLIAERVREAVGPLQGEILVQIFTEKDTCLNGGMDPCDFREIILNLTKFSLNEHEVNCLIRAFRIDAPLPPPDMNTLQAVIQTDLQRFNFDKHLLSRLEYTLRYHDPCRLGVVDRETLRSTLKGARLPTHKELIDFLVDNFPSADECCRVNYCQVMNFINWIDNGVPRATPAHVQCVLKWLEPKPPKSKVFCVNYRAFLEMICPNLYCFLPNICCPPEGENQGACGPSEHFPRPCPCDDPCGPSDRDLAGVVISDNQVMPERYRCELEDQYAAGCIPCEPPKRNVIWTSRDFDNVDPCLLDAYEPPMENDCYNNEGGEREVFRPGDFIGSDDLYR